MVRIIVSGIVGRMGKRIGALALEDKDIELTGALEAPASSSIGKDIGEVLGLASIGKNIETALSDVGGAGNVLIEFTAPDATISHLKDARKKKIGMVIGTTGLTPAQVGEIKAASKDIPIVLSPNMSIGANLLFELTEAAARTLSKDYKVEIVEAHHAKKKDAPSGTAKRLGEAVSKVRGVTPAIHSIREGDIVGDHAVTFSGKLEMVEMKHSAHSRDAFAKGALDAAKFIAGKKSGLYSMHDVISGERGEDGV